MYTGTKSTTVSGKTCQRWDQQYPHKHGYANARLDEKFAAKENYCRGFEYKKPWCYTTDPKVRWEECDIMHCYM